MKTEKLFDPYQIKLFGINKAVTYSMYILKFKFVKKDSFGNLKPNFQVSIMFQGAVWT